MAKSDTRKERIHQWWQKVKKPLEIISVTAVLVLIIGLVVLIIAGYIFKWSWTGFEPETSAPPQHAKTLWDWLQLLIIPLVLAVGGYVFNLTVSRNEQQNTQLRDQTERKNAQVRDQTERDISLDNQQEDALQAYINNMSDLLLHEKLREPVAEDEVQKNEAQKIARVRTLTVLPRLDNRRKGAVLQFLLESGLIEKNKAIVNLRGANFTYADLSGAILRGADLSLADFRYANLRDANLIGTNLIRTNLNSAKLNDAVLIDANLSDADLSGADLSGAILRGADLSFAILSDATVEQEQLDKASSLQRTTMPNDAHPYF